MWNSKETPASAEGSVSESSGASTGECICYREWPKAEIETETEKENEKENENEE